MMRWVAMAVILLGGAAVIHAAVEDPDGLLEGLSSADPRDRAEARRALRELGPAATEILAAGLKSGDPLVAGSCAELAGDLGLRMLREDVAALAGAEDGPRLVRAAAASALGRIGDSRDVPLLVSLAGEHPEAALALVELEAVDAADPLADLLATDPQPAVAYAVARLGRYEAGVPALLDLLDDAESSLAARRRLRELAGRDAGGDPSAWREWWRREKLARELGDPDWDASEAALRRVLDLPRTGAEFRIVHADLLHIAQDRNARPESRWKAILALGLIGRAADAPAIVELLKTDADPHVRVYAAEAVGRIRAPAAIVDLVEYLVFDEEPFRKLSLREPNREYFTIDTEVCKALVAMGVKGGLDFMIRQLGENRRIRIYHEAVRTLRGVTGRTFGFIPDAPLVERQAAAARWRAWFDENRESLSLPVPKEVDLRDPALRQRIRGLVAELGVFKFLDMMRAREALVLLGEAALPEVTEGLSSPNFHVRAACLQVLGRIHAKRARGAVAALLQDPEPVVRAQAAATLADMGPGDATGHVIDALSDESPDVRVEAARALAKSDAARAVPVLRRVLRGEVSDALRRETLYALGAHGETSAVDDLQRMLDHPDTAFRQVVALRLAALTGKKPGVERESIAAWREWWRVSRESYRGVRAGEFR